MNMERKIPQVIHYCWFGGSKLSDEAVKCMDSWKKFFPGYQIQRWDESNFDCESCNYVKEAYQAGKYAFVSDYARFWILYHYGGLYFDTDVLIIKPFDDIIAKGAFMGCESTGACAPGLGLGFPPKDIFLRSLLSYYSKIHYTKPNGLHSDLTVADITTMLLKKRGFQQSGKIEKISGILIYPSEYFCPVDFRTGRMKITDHTHSIHYYSASWLTKREKRWKRLEQCMRRMCGSRVSEKIFDHPLWVLFRLVHNRGCREVVKRLKEKIL